MKATQKLHDMGQSLWLDNITRRSTNSAARCAITLRTSQTIGLTSEPYDFRSRDQEQPRLRRGHPPEIE